METEIKKKRIKLFLSKFYKRKEYKTDLLSAYCIRYIVSWKCALRTYSQLYIINNLEFRLNEM